jgi:hypothetical protein
LILVGAAIFIVAWAFCVIRVLTARSCALPSNALAESAPVLLQALPLPFVAIVLQATLYNAVRQYLFIVPALAISATLGLWLVVNLLRERQVNRAVLNITWVLAGLGLVAPVVSQILLYPYTYVYYNALTTIAPIDGRWPTDYWRASSNELMRRLPAQGTESCAYEQTRRGTLWACANEPMFKPYLNERGVDAKPGTLLADQYWLIRENQGRTEDPQGCKLHDEITRNLFLQTITIGQIYACNSNAVIPENGPPDR